MAAPHLILVGYGATDALQLTVEAQRVLSRYGSACTIGLPPNLAMYLKSQRVRVTDLSDRLAPERAAAEAYLDIGHFLIERTAHERPVVALMPGHPLLFNAIGRYLAMEAGRLGLVLQVVPGVSQLDAILGGIGLDISTFGLQVFDSARLMSRRQEPNPGVPLLLMHAGNLAGDGSGPAPLAELGRYLERWYPADHPLTLVDLDGHEIGLRVARATLEALIRGKIPATPGTHLYLDAIRTVNGPLAATPAGTEAGGEDHD